MNPRKTPSSFTTLSATTIIALCATVAIPAYARQESKPAPIQTLLVMERAALSDLVVDPKDQALRGALAMLPQRIAELPGESPDLDANAAAAINLILTTISRPGRVGITVNAGNPADGLFGYGVVLSAAVQDEKDAVELHQRVTEALKNVPLPEAPGGPKRFPTMDDTQLPGAIGRLSFGPRLTAEGWRYEVIAGTLENPDAAWSQIPRARSASVKPVIRGQFDFAGLNNAVNMLGAFAGPQNPQVGEGIRQAGEYGLYGTNAIKVRFEYGYSKTETVGHVAIDNAGKYAEKYAISREVLTESDLAAIPADATMASVSRADLAMLRRAIEAGKQGNPDFGPGLDKFKEMTGVDLLTDVVDALGGTVAYYTSDSTGGGSIGSLVAMITVKDRTKFAAAHEKLVGFANNVATTAKDVGKYARIVAWKEAGVPMMSLKFAGLPIPFEVSYSLTDRWLVAGLTPQAVVAAVKQTALEGKGLLAKPRIAELAKANKLVSVAYIDTARMIHAGYPLASMVGSAVGNAVRSPAFLTQTGRNPGMITPTFQEFSKDVHDSIWTTHWEGESFVMESHSDRSLLVGIAGYSGVLAQLALPIAAAAAAADANNKHRQHETHDDEMNGHNDDEQSMRPVWENDPGLALSFSTRDPVVGFVLWATR